MKLTFPRVWRNCWLSSSATVHQVCCSKPVTASSGLNRISFVAISIRLLRKSVSRKQEHTGFRRYRNTFLRNLTDCSENVRDFWLGWGSAGMSVLYDQIKPNVEFRKEEANRVGVGFDVPASLASIGPIKPRKVEEEVAVTA